jgi:NAD(P)-dependent dehydrogenase (short-subunit alcohol dehydrogenase family)
LVVVGLDPIPEVPQIKDVHDRLEVILADARDAGVADHAIERCAQRYGQFHALYHVAGGSGRAWGDGPLHTIPLEGWQQTLELNLTTAFLSNGAAIRWFLRENQPGCILNCGSVLASSPSPNLFGTAAYATAKSALVGLTQATAAAYAPHNIRVNLLAPGLTATPMSLRAQSNPVIQEFITRKQPLDGGRMGRPNDLDAAVIWLLSEGSRFVTGQVIAVDGGWSVSDASPPQGLSPQSGSAPLVP